MYFADQLLTEDTGSEENHMSEIPSSASPLGWSEWPHDDPCSLQPEIMVPDAAYGYPAFPATSTVHTFSDLAHAYSNPRALALRLSEQVPDSSPVSFVQESPAPRSSGLPPPVATACVTCRSRHLKCNGKNPCIRCVDAGVQCTYVASRRGYRGPSNKVTKLSNKRRILGLADGLPKSTEAAEPAALGGTPAVSTSSPTSSVALANHAVTVTSSDNINFKYHVNIPIPSSFGPDAASAYQPFGYEFSRTPSPTYALQPTLKERSINSFYHYFFPAYPFVLPQGNLLLLTGVCPIEPVLAAIEWIGSFYIGAGAASVKLFQTAYRMVYDPERKKDGFVVQAMLLLIIGLDGLGDRTAVCDLLREIERLSVELGFNTSTFSMANGLDSIMSESWRRTWWELYIVDALISAARGKAKFLIDSIPAEAALPCEEHQYLSGDIPPPNYLSDMDDSDLSDRGLTFSSFAYCIQAARIIGLIAKSPMRTNPRDNTPDQMEKLITTWKLSLPVCKRNILYTDRDNRLDEMLFQAHMIIHATSIYLHQPYSQLATSRDWDSELRSEFTPEGAEKSFNIHTSRVIQAAEEITQMITLPTPLLFHSHFFAYAIVISLLIHVGESTSMFLPHKMDTIRQGIRLSIGALGEFGRVWYTAALGSVRIKTAAQELARLKQK